MGTYKIKSMTTSSKTNITLKEIEKKFRERFQGEHQWVDCNVDTLWCFIEQAIIQAENSKVEEIRQKFIEMTEFDSHYWVRQIDVLNLLHQPKENKKG
jgi:hypothetical protein